MRNTNATLMFVIFSALFAASLSNNAEGSTVIVNTGDTPIHAGLENRGWYRKHFSGSPGQVSASDNYLVGSSAGYEHRNFFSFDLASAIPSGMQVVSATLELTRHANSGRFPLTFNLFDVSTDVLALNSHATYTDAIFDDLGSGTSYGGFGMTTELQAHVDTFTLNAAALADINAAAHGWFSIGGAIDLTGRPVDVQSHNLYGSSQGNGGVQRLILEVQSIAAVPEPGSWVLLGSLFVSLTLPAIRRGYVRGR